MAFRLMSVTRCGLVMPVTLMFGMASAADAAILFNATTDFSATLNPNGAWSYGQTATLGGSFSPLLAGSCGPLTGWNSSGASATGGSPPFIFKGVGTCGTGTLTSGELDLHPGSAGQYADVRWTAPGAGSFVVTGFFTGIDPHPTTTDVHVLQNSAALFNGAVASLGMPLSFSLTGTVAAGDRLQFVVGFGQDGDFGFDSTAFNAEISFQPSAAIPEPGSIVLLGTGLLIVVRRLRQKRASVAR